MRHAVQCGKTRGRAAETESFEAGVVRSGGSRAAAGSRFYGNYGIFHEGAFG